jgi:hypothetical protein
MNLMGNKENGQSINDCWKKVSKDVEIGDVPPKANFRMWIGTCMLFAYLPESNDNPNLLTQETMAQAMDECQIMVAITYYCGVPTVSTVNCSKICAIELIQEVS